MATHTYTISAGASVTSTTAPSIYDAAGDFQSNDRLGAGTGVVGASDTLYFKIQGFLTGLNGDSLRAITVTAGGQVIIESNATPINSAIRALGYSASFDGLSYAGNESLVISAKGGVTIRDLVITSTTPSNGAVLEVSGASSTFRNTIDSCVIRNSGSGANCIGVFLKHTDMYNSLVLMTGNGTGQKGIDHWFSTLASNVHHCTVVSLQGPAGSNGASDINGAGGALIIKNSYFGGFTTPFGGFTYAGTSVGNAGSSSDTPNSGLINVALSTTNFENVTDSTEDLRVKAASVLKTTGATQLGSLTTDFFGTARSATATIGAFEASGGAAAPNPPLPPQVLSQAAGRAGFY